MITVQANSIRTYLRKIIFLSLIIFLSACTQWSSLFTNLSEKEANEVYAVLLRAGFDAQKRQEDKGFSVLVPNSMAGEALDLLSSKGLPKERKSSIKEMFPDDSMIASPLQEKARYLYALSQDLERTLMTVDGVLEARVHLVLPEGTVSEENMTPSSVAVFVKYDKTSPFPAYLAQIRQLVLSSIPSLPKGDASDRISIVAVPSESKIDDPLSLVWFGPLAIKVQDRFYFLGVIYFLVGLWALSLIAMYLSCVEPIRRPRFLRAILKTDKNIEDNDLIEQGAEQ